MRHASFFSGVGGLDLGFERAGIETVSVSEIDPYANAVLAERFPDAPNLGSITEVDANDIPEADIWSGGFPCQDLSVAGKRAGFAGKRSSLAFTFLDLVEQRKPRWLLLENVPGLFSSNNGADFGRLLYEMEQLGYGVSWRSLDARYFGVAQRRRRVFIVGSLESDRAGEVLFECEGCERHPSPRWTQRQGVAGGAPDGSGIAGAITRRFSKGVNSTIDEPLIVSASPDSDGVRAADGLARRVDNQSEVDTFGAETHRALQARDWKGGVSNQDIGQEGYLVGYQTRVDEKNGNFSLSEAEVANSLSALWPSDTSHRSMTLIAPSESILSLSEAKAVVFRRMGPGKYGPTDGIAGPNLASGGDAGGGSENIITFSAQLTDASAKIREHSLSLLTQGDAAVYYDNQVRTTDIGDVKTTHATVTPTFYGRHDQDGRMKQINIAPTLSSKSDNSVDLPHTLGVFPQNNDDPLLPVGLDSHRYRCCGNGVVAPVAEWIGRRIVEVDRRWREEEAK